MLYRKYHTRIESKKKGRGSDELKLICERIKMCSFQRAILHGSKEE